MDVLRSSDPGVQLLEGRGDGAGGRPSRGVWTGRVRATVASAEGPTPVRCEFVGSLDLTVYLSSGGDEVLVGGRTVRPNSVLGNLSGAFRTDASPPSGEGGWSGEGAVSYFVGGAYDPSAETIRIGVHPAAMEATGRRTLPGDPAGGSPPAVAPLAVNWNTGRRSAMDDAYEDLRVEPIRTAPPEPPAFHPARAGDRMLLESVPRTRADPGEPPMTLDLRNPEPQTIVQTDPCGIAGQTRVTTWNFMLTPVFELVRRSPPQGAAHSFLSTDELSFDASMPGLTFPGSRWEGLLEWRVSGDGPHSGTCVPDSASETSSFSFRPNPSSRPTSGSDRRNRPLSYHVVAGLEGTTQHYFLVQDELDVLRQEYLDHGFARIPARSEFVPSPLGGALNQGNYGYVIDTGMDRALAMITNEFSGPDGGSLRVTRGFMSPQRNVLAGGSRVDGVSLGESLELAPEGRGPEAWSRLRRACSAAGYAWRCETQAGAEAPCDSPAVHHLRLNLPQSNTNETESIRLVSRKSERGS